VTRRNRVNPLEKRCEDTRPSLRHEKHRSFLFSRLDLLKRTDPDEAVKTSSVEGKRYSYLPLLAPPAVVSRSAASSCCHRAFASDRIIPEWSSPSSIERYSCGQWSSLCVKNGLLQACVLLATQGDNSHIRWSTTQECQHVLSLDIRPSFKKLLHTSPALLQEVTFPANFMLRNVSTPAPGFEAGVRLLQGGRRPSTVKSYDQKCLKFENFTAQVQDDTGASRMSALPASSHTVVAYLVTSSNQAPSAQNRFSLT
jgi:hypothetical protein